MVFEDAPLGIEAARRAGMGAVALTTTLPAAAFDGYANLMSTMPASPEASDRRLPPDLPA
jgi:beta-phosphoglucomutase